MKLRAREIEKLLERLDSSTGPLAMPFRVISHPRRYASNTSINEDITRISRHTGDAVVGSGGVIVIVRCLDAVVVVFFRRIDVLLRFEATHPNEGHGDAVFAELTIARALRTRTDEAKTITTDPDRDFVEPRSTQ